VPPGNELNAVFPRQGERLFRTRLYDQGFGAGFGVGLYRNLVRVGAQVEALRRSGLHSIVISSTNYQSDFPPGSRISRTFGNTSVQGGAINR
jgi:hypothetical protein